MFVSLVIADTPFPYLQEPPLLSLSVGEPYAHRENHDDIQ